MEMKKILESLQECGAMPVTQPQQQGTPVTVNVSLNASGKENVEDLLSMMKNAGLSQAREVGQDMMPMRMDMERLRSIVDGPQESLEEEFPDELDAFVNSNRPNFEVDEYSDDWDAAQEQFVARVKKAGHQVTDINDEASPVVVAMNGEEPVAWYDFENTAGFIKPVGEAYANEPDEKYDDHETMIHDLSGGINREKKQFKPAAKGDNPMAVESIKDKLYAMLAEKKAKPDFADLDKDGDKKEPMKKAAKDAKVKEGWDDMIKAGEKKSKEKGTGKFDSKKTSTGTVYTRKSSTYSDGGTDADMKKANKKVKEGDYTQHAMDLNPDMKKKPGGIMSKLAKGAKKVANMVAPDDEELIRRLEKSSGGKRPNK